MKQTIEAETNSIKLSLETPLRENFTAHALVIWIQPDRTISKIYYNSYRFGTVLWLSDQGFVDCHSWESEDQAMEGSFLQRMYPTITHNGVESVDYARRIKEDVLSSLPLPADAWRTFLMNLDSRSGQTEWPFALDAVAPGPHDQGQ
ncbi:MAG: hypothetical protein KDK39_07320 [Leptospiraceae bacterium]|nr:hypothetical protein [Leptospiraceae bacterium]